MSLDIKSQEHENIRPYISNYEFDFTLVQFHLSFAKSELDLVQKWVHKNIQELIKNFNPMLHQRNLNLVD